MKTKDEYGESLALELKERTARIDLLFSMAENFLADVKLKYAEELDGKCSLPPLKKGD